MRKAFPYLYSLFILSQYMIGQLFLPGIPLNILQITTLLMLSFCILIDRKLPHDKYIVLYVVFLIFYMLSSMLTGYTETLFGSVFPQVIISFTAFWATKILVQKYDSIAPLVVPAILVGVVDSVVTISQAVGDPIVSPIIVMLMQDPEAFDIASNGMLGISVSGLYANPVFNGHNLLFCFVSSLFVLRGRHKLVGFASSIIILTGLFFCQQRSAFYLSVLVLLVIGWKMMQNNLKTKLLIIFSTVIVVFYLLPHIESYVIDSGSRLMDVSMTSRDDIWEASINFLSDHILIGGFDKFVQGYGRFPHNLILSAFLAGGLIGGVVLMVLIFILLLTAYRSLKYYNKGNISLYVSACLLTVLIADSLTHNTGFVEADFSTLLAMSLCCYYNERNPQKVLTVF